MLGRVKAWLQERHSKQPAIERALGTFRETHGAVPMGGYALCHDSQQTIVRVMHMTDHIPPNRGVVCGFPGRRRGSGTFLRRCCAPGIAMAMIVI
jgi:hypothetical protein